MLEVISAEYVGGHRVRIAFNNGEEGIVDLAGALWGAVFEPLKDPAAFQRFDVSPVLHTLHWENDADLAPEYLYEKMVEQRNAAEQGDHAFSYPARLKLVRRAKETLYGNLSTAESRD
jgi:hypothetical protein